jgi:hypothetical protein
MEWLLHKLANLYSIAKKRFPAITARCGGAIQTDVAEHVARMERSVIRECGAPIFPDYVALHPGYNTVQVREIMFESHPRCGPIGFDMPHDE